MRPEIIGLLIPIVFLIGLFAVIALNIISKYKTKAMIANRMSSVDDWYRAEAQAKIVKAEAQVSRKRGIGLRICGLVIGLGLGVAIGCIALACGAVSYDSMNGDFSAVAVASFLVISLAMVCGGAGMIGAWFFERRLDSKTK